jgi:hypothetical protein
VNPEEAYLQQMQAAQQQAQSSAMLASSPWATGKQYGPSQVDFYNSMAGTIAVPYQSAPPCGAYAPHATDVSSYGNLMSQMLANVNYRSEVPAKVYSDTPIAAQDVAYVPQSVMYPVTYHSHVFPLVGWRFIGALFLVLDLFGMMYGIAAHR